MRQGKAYKIHNYYIRNIFILIFSIITVFFICIKPTFASTKVEEEVLKFEDRISSKITNKFCNSIAFGISKESALIFSAGESKKEINKNKYSSYIDIDQLEYKIASKIIDKCGISIGFYGQTGIDEFIEFLSKSSELEYLNTD
tara:strand:+ start:9119 stop:9547 length:429 start_codon:yes stop_codon:yes gene_type:complete